MQPSQQQRFLQAIETFFTSNLHQGKQSTGENAKDLETEIINLFQEVATTVPAYQTFLKEQQIDPKTVKTLTDFQSLPLTTKDNYLKLHSLPNLCRYGRLETCDFVSVSSGTTGNPTFWPRFVSDEYQIARQFEQVFLDSFQADKKRTLAVVCFPLGTWVGGIYTANCCRHLATKGYPITTVTPGNNKPEIFKVVQDLGIYFEQVVLLGYPPFLKDVIDSGIAQGLDWSRYSIKLVMAGEVISEQWRTLVGERVKSTNFCYDSASLYGTADAGVLGNETPLSIGIRRFLAENPPIARHLFGQSRLPTLVQYDPSSRFFEVVDGTLLFSGNNGIPLIRYHINDQGGIISYEEMLTVLGGYGFDPIKTLNNGGESRGIHPLPFVYVFGRSHYTLSYYGANIYPENIAIGLEQPVIREWVTGKFVMDIGKDDNHNPFLLIIVELALNITESQDKQAEITNAIQSQLLRLNSEFANYVPSTSQRPTLILRPLGDPEYFPVGVKHRYTRQIS
ncbi:conserved hypothetical protein [Gloeothece citriformis PCC 7424]|uniref:Phenylacetate--CoA ligase n=1 Tax=Gloeothece citriformis (strain PCC 7424) TaxID=65393 RepID=B7KH88_GLOC7|nr:phenylacetate--CoA ligase family protein [Gloeothece citriformis]ACK69297.1 conserved hypothetical protein [Gloeothece citriformis PCC 7424]